MFGAVNTDILFDLERAGASIVTVLIAQQFDQEVVRWITDSWDEINILSGRSWHVVVPTSQYLAGPRTELKSGDYNVRVANQLREIYGIRREDTPGLVIDNFDDTSRQLFFRLEGDPKALKDDFLRIARYLKDHPAPDGGGAGNSISRWRRKTCDGLFDQLQMGALPRRLMRLTPIAGSLIKLAASHGTSN